MIDCDFFLLLRVDSSGDFDFPQLENSLQVNPFPPHPAFFLFFIINVMLFPHFAGNHTPVCPNDTVPHLLSFLFQMYFPLSPTMNDICSKSLRSLRCRLEMGKTSTNSNSTTGLIKKSIIIHSDPNQINFEREERRSSREIATLRSSSSPPLSCSSSATFPGWSPGSSSSSMLQSQKHQQLQHLRGS